MATNWLARSLLKARFENFNNMDCMKMAHYQTIKYAAKQSNIWIRIDTMDTASLTFINQIVK